MATEEIGYDRKDLAKLKKAFEGMSDEAVAQAKEVTIQLAKFAQAKIQMAARSTGAKVDDRVADGSKVAKETQKASAVGTISFGYASQRFSGGATTQSLWPGYEFGSNKFKQFPNRRPSGYFIYPTLRAIQPSIVDQWEKAFSEISGKWDD